LRDLEFERIINDLLVKVNQEFPEISKFLQDYKVLTFMYYNNYNFLFDELMKAFGKICKNFKEIYSRIKANKEE
jgi:hypothetical protein